MKNSENEIKRLRKYVDMTQTEFSSYTDIPLNTIKNWESGKSKAPDYVINMLKATIVMEKSNKEDKSRKLMAYYEKMMKEV